MTLTDQQAAVALKAIDSAPVQGIESMLQAIETAAQLSPQLRVAIASLNQRVQPPTQEER